ncbi:CRAL-TRIO domain containing protein [Nitzschia inconspicua]|uniref:CRAL-TRIO domain containing protein n=1 Tax=Nitzschia inconspicua TaxID=303405 RepID=A0A9K3PQI4_9STRA|nr:CRAL-TRIO domain containing protein [Nitzschia inconspicua]
MPSPMFVSTSSENPQRLTIDFKDDPQGSLGAQLINCDKGEPYEMFSPGFAQIGRLLEGDTVAQKAGVQVGDIIVAVNGSGFRRFAPDYDESKVTNISKNGNGSKENGNSCANDNAVMHMGQGEAYSALLTKIKTVKSGGDPPLVLSLERYTWDARVNSWPRFLEAREGDVPAAMKLLQDHEAWKSKILPIDLTRDGIQEVLRLKAVAEIDVDKTGEHPPTVYVNFAKLLVADGISSDDVIKCFIIFTEMLLARSKDPRFPKTNQFIDLTGLSMSSGFRVELMRRIYEVFEPNYPETLGKMVMFPVSTMLSTTAKTLLSFVNEKTQKKFILSSSLKEVCDELGWDQTEVEQCGGVTEFMHKHESAGAALILE